MPRHCEQRGKVLTYDEFFARFGHEVTFGMETAEQYVVRKYQKDHLEIRFLDKRPAEVWFLNRMKLYKTYFTIVEPAGQQAFHDRYLSSSPIMARLLLDVGVIGHAEESDE